MSSLKRKSAPGDNPPPKSAKANKESRPSNPKSQDAKPVRSKPATAPAGSSAPQVAKSSVVSSLLREEEPMFPRGGASILTPLEKKEINIKAKADAQKEGEFAVSTEKPTKAKFTSKKKSSKSGKSTGVDEEDDAVKVESLNFKKLVKGSLVLAQITDITPLEIVLALPNNITGYVSIVSVSDQLTTRIQKEADDEDTESGNEDQEETDSDKVTELKSLFRIGQFVRASVQSTDDITDSTKTKRRIELSLRPQDANTGLGKDDVVANSTIMASIVSVEDHGCVMDVGLADSTLKGFLPRKHIDSSIGEENLQTGATLLCLVTGKSANGKIVQLSTSLEKLAKPKSPTDATTINTFLPGTIADVLVTSTSARGLVGKILGHLDATADLIHSGIGPTQVDLEKKYTIGSKVKARIICNFSSGSDPKVGISLLPHILALSSQTTAGRDKNRDPLTALPISSTVESCTVKYVQDGIGLFVDVGVPGISGFVHISRVKDGKVDALYSSSGAHKLDSVHPGRVVGYNPIDGIYQLSFEQSVLDQKFLRFEDVPVGTVVSGEITKLIIDKDGLSGLVVKIDEGITGYVVSRHFSDVKLQHPEKKFREGMKVKCRVLSVDATKRQIKLTLKKTLVNSDAPAIKSYDEATVGLQTLGTILTVKPKGAHIRFYGSLEGFLPVSEMSEAYIQNPADHFKPGQVVNVHILEVNPESRRLIVSCKDPSAFGLEKQTALRNLKIGDLVSAKVTEKTEDDVFLELVEGELKAVLPVVHLSDKLKAKVQGAWKRLYVGQTISGLMVLDKHEGRRSIILTQKASLIKAHSEGNLPASYEEAKEGTVASGFIKNIATSGVVVGFAGNLQGLLPAMRLPAEVKELKNWGMEKGQSISVVVRHVNVEQKRMFLSSVRSESSEKKEKKAKKEPKAFEEGSTPAINAVDQSIVAIEDIKLGMLTKARVVSVKETQLNVRLADNIQGRIDVSQLFDSWDEIKDAKNPLNQFRDKPVLDVRILGVHDARNHRFLPFSHRSGNSVLELSAKPSDVKASASPEMLTLNKVEVGSSHLAFVNNIGPQCLWVNLSPSARGRINAFEASDDVSLLQNLSGNFPIGSALRVKVVGVDASNNRLDLSARSLSSSSTSNKGVTWDTVKPNAVLPGRITKVSERQMIVQLSDTVSGPVHLPDLCDNFAEANMTKHSKHEIIRVSVVEVDKSNKRIRLSTRQSRILSSTSPVEDAEIKSVSQLSSGDIVRGFVKNVADKGVFISLGGSVDALVKIANLSDRFIKEWKDEFQVDQLVTGRIIFLEPATGNIELSLKKSVVDSNYVPLKSFHEMKEGQVVTGKVRKVEEFGAFIVVDGSNNVSGLCHKSQMADDPVTDAKKLYEEGDAVKAVILSIDSSKKRISFGLKPSLFAENDSDDDDDSDGAGVKLNIEDDDSDDDSEGGIPFSALANGDLEMESGDEEEDSDEELDDAEMDDGDDDDDEDDDDDVDMEDASNQGLGGDGKYDWDADAFDKKARATQVEDDAEPTKKKRLRTRGGEIQVDKTAELDINGPQTSSDYERLLLGQPDSSALWIAYMAFQVQASELPKARQVAERAIKTINIREDNEKLNVWIALLNLEVAYGNATSVEEVFKRACQYNDQQEVHERLASIYIQSGKHKKADELFASMLKKFGSKSPTVWINAAHFYHVTTGEPERARALLPRASQALESRHNVTVISRFAALEFRSPNGEPERGRTMFEGLLAALPKKGDLWNQLLDLEIGRAKSDNEQDMAAVRDVFERRTKAKGLKPQQALKWFGRWADWEEKVSGAKGKERVLARTQEWVSAFQAKKGQDE